MKDEFRPEALATALARDEIIFTMSYGFHPPPGANKLLIDTEAGNPETDIKGAMRVGILKEYLSCLPKLLSFQLDAASLKTWLNKTYPLEPGQESKRNPEFMSKELEIADECSRSLYKAEPTSGATAKDDAMKIRGWLQDNYPELKKTITTRITQIVNPGEK